MNFKTLWEKLKRNLLDPKKPIWILVTLALMGVMLTIFQQKDIEPPKRSQEESASLDTFIPAGFVLVTLQLINSDSIESMIGSYCLVDLYPGSNEPDFQLEKMAKPIAKRLRLIRAPNNPSLFGVLVPEEDPVVIQKLAGPVFAVIQGPNAKALPAPVRVTPKRYRSIKYGDLL